MNVIRFSDLCAQGKAKGQRVFIRADLNVPQDASGAITEDTRIRASVPCIQMALDAGAAVMVTSHLGRPTEGELTPADSLAPVARRLGELLGRAVPLVAIVAGSKVSTKLTILKSLAAKVDQLIVGGGIANTFMLAAGLPIGKSLAEPDLVDQAKAVMAAMKARGAEVPIPTDVVTAKAFKADAKAEVKAAADVAADDMILDIGPQTAAKLADQLRKAGTIVWNGPVGVFEMAPFENGTKVIAQAIAASPAFSIAGGGDTLAAIAKYGIEDKVGYISTGGGAFLEVLEGKTLPAFEILGKRATG